MDDSDVNKLADQIKQRGGLQSGDILLIPAGTSFDVPVYMGRHVYTFSAETYVRVDGMDYDWIRIVRVDEAGNRLGLIENLYSLPNPSTFKQFKDAMVPDWSSFKINDKDG